ncbi:MAG: hypothetical protein JST92_03050 [Deltaproteobacteria bacterium]|nr:hypothetical protein [Deltaproteobacteria bacterium]
MAGVPYSGVAVEYSEDGKILNETPYHDGFEHGLRRSWYRGGSLWLETPFFHGRVLGICKEWHPSGNLRRMMEVDSRGKRIKECEWNADGVEVKFSKAADLGQVTPEMRNRR